MSKKPLFHEYPSHRESNDKRGKHSDARPAVLSDGRPGAAIFLGGFGVCYTLDQAMHLASDIANTITYWKEQETNE